ncbi:MAG: AmmeMemoRadiSam system protein B [Patescibacteria group bacterium]
MIRESAVAGAFYPDDPKELQKMIEDFLATAKPPAISGRLRALIVPHAGYVYSGLVAAFGYKVLADCHSRPRSVVPANAGTQSRAGSSGNPATGSPCPKKVILLGPAHTVSFVGAATSSAAVWTTPLGDVQTWQPKNLEAPFFEFDVAHLQEHCLEVQLPFLQHVLAFPPARGGIEGGGSFKIFPVVIGEADPEAVAQELIKLIDDETFLIVSSDLSHYLPYRQAQAKDKMTIEAIIKGWIAVLEVQGDACGLLPILTLLRLAKKRNWRGQLLDYRNSGDTFGDKDRVVGYASIAFSE